MMINDVVSMFMCDQPNSMFYNMTNGSTTKQRMLIEASVIGGHFGSTPVGMNGVEHERFQEKTCLYIFVPKLR